MSLALLSSMVLVATANYIPFEAKQKETMMTQLQAALLAYEDGVGRYLRAQRVLIDPANPDLGYYIPYPGKNTDLKPSLLPQYLFEPRAYLNSEWDVRASKMNAGSLDAVAVCMKPKSGAVLTPQELTVLGIVKNKLPANSIVLGNSCGATTDTPTGDHLTLWIPYSHYE